MGNSKSFHTHIKLQQRGCIILARSNSNTEDYVNILKSFEHTDPNQGHLAFRPGPP